MSKKRVHELAKEIGVDSKELLHTLQDLSISVKTHASSLSDDEATKVIKYYKDKDKPKAVKKENNTVEPKKVVEKTGQGNKPASSSNSASSNKSHRNQRPRNIQKPSQPGTNQRSQNNRSSQNNSTQSNKPQGNRPQGNRPQNNSTQGNKPQGNRPQGNRPQNDSTQGNKPQNNSTQGNRPQNTQSKPGNNSGTSNNKNTSANKNNTNSRNNSKNNNTKNNANKPYTPRNLERKEKKKVRKRSREDVIVEESVVESGVIYIGDQVSVKNLAEKLECGVSDLVKSLMLRGIMATANQEINFELATELALEFDILVEKEDEEDFIEEFFKEEEVDEDSLVKRSPVVVVMGHVDHGKTSLLDSIRQAKVTEGEHGGITQHIGAYSVDINGEQITFLDTPGHEAFTAMRLRGAMATDIAILVVAADDGVMPQTIEAINHAKAAGVEIIVAINKIDKEGANPDRVKQELVEYGLVAEDWGGDTTCVNVSAIKKTGIDELLEMIILVSELGELKADPKAKARGTIVEAQLDKGRGPVATVLVQNGTLKVGDSILAGSTHGRVRAMVNDKGRRVKSAGPSTPVEILGLNEVPVAGEAFYVADNERVARQLSEKLQSAIREKMIQNTPQKVSLDDLFHQIHEGEMKELKLIVKADVQGSVEAVKQSLMKLSNEEVLINIIHGGVGAINESDVMLASASNAIIIGFNVRPESTARQVAEAEQIDVRLYRVIYNAIEDIELAMKGMLDPIFEEKIIGHAEVRDLFKVSSVGTIAGSYVLDGKIQRNSQVRLVRGGIVLYEGGLATLKRFKDDAKEVATGFECGILLEKFNDLKVGDVIEAFIMEEIPR